MKIKAFFFGLVLVILSFVGGGAKAMMVDVDSRIDVNLQKVTPNGWVIEGEWTKCEAATPVASNVPPQYAGVKACTIKGKILKTVTDHEGKVWAKGSEGEWSFRFPSAPMARGLVAQPGMSGIFMMWPPSKTTGNTSFIPGSTIQFKTVGGQARAVNVPTEAAQQFKDVSVLEQANGKAFKALQSFRATTDGIPAKDVTAVVEGYIDLIYGK